jgi:branched-subunit amino acid transport protein
VAAVSGWLLWLTIAGMALLTYALRISFLLLHERITFPPLVRRALRYVPYAVLAALVVPAVFGSPQDPFEPRTTRLLAGLIGAAVAWRTRSVILTLALGMSALWLIQLLP